jgi:hypothetical protein
VFSLSCKGREVDCVQKRSGLLFAAPELFLHLKEEDHNQLKTKFSSRVEITFHKEGKKHEPEIKLIKFRFMHE